MSEADDLVDGGRQRGGETTDETASQQARAVCCICGSPACYTCPACGRRTCSLTCVRVHKSDFACPGRRDVAAKVSLGDFDDAQLQRDFYFLEDCRRVIDNVERGWRQGVTTATTTTGGQVLSHNISGGYKRGLPPVLAALREAAKRRGVLCQIMSSGMWKHESNTSHYDRVTNTITWRCVFRFHRPRHQASEPGDAGDATATAVATTSCDKEAEENAKDVNGGCKDDGDFTVTTDAGCERCKLDHLLRYCWASDLTALPRLPIHLRYNRTTEYVQAAKDKESGVSSKGCDGEVERGASSEPSCEMRGQQECVAQHANVHTAATSEDASDTPDDDELVDPSRPPLPPPPIARDGCVEEAITVRQPESWETLVRPANDTEARNAARVRAFLARANGAVAVLVKAERLAGDPPRYFRLVLDETLNENLRRVFFISEYPVFEVVHAAEVGHYTLVTETDKAALRLSLRPKQYTAPAQETLSAPHGDSNGATAVTVTQHGDRDDEGRNRMSGGRLARVPCRMYLAQRCTAGEACPYRHCSAAEVSLCLSYAKRGHCARGSRCGFRHDAAATRPTCKRPRPSRRPPMSRDERVPPDTQDAKPSSV